MLGSEEIKDLQEIECQTGIGIAPETDESSGARAGKRTNLSEELLNTATSRSLRPFS